MAKLLPLLLLILAPLAPAQEDALRAAAAAMKAGDLARAREHYRNALWWAPEDPAILGGLLRATEDPAARLRVALTLADAVVDRDGKVRLPRDLVEGLPEDFDAVARARAAAVRELLRFAEKLPASRSRVQPANVLADWALAVGRELVADAPALRAQALPALAKARERTGIPPEPVLKSLERVLERMAAAGRDGDAVELSRVLYGLANQAGFKDLEGPEPPDLSGLKAEAGRRLGEARQKLAADLGEPLTVDQLLAMDEEEAKRFTAEHASFAHPGVAVSPNGLYRIETACGRDTLLGVADTIEAHHRRLVNWYGTDPFVGRPGLVRVVSEHADMEMEGEPFWWAGGFQGGDTTTVRFISGTIEGLGHGITHELTHRFDGALFPGMPAWLVEGRAVWTGGSYGATWDEEFTEGVGSPGQMERALVLGYGARNKLEELIAGTIDDYRDNYPVGYSLYLYLHTWPVGEEPWYRDRLEEYQREVGTKGRKDPVGYFEKTFADGEGGRPDGMAAFATDFGKFLGGFYWQNRAPWSHVYEIPLVGPKDPPVVFDPPTWVWSRGRAEPVFGQDQAARAGDLLFRLDEKDAATDAWLWSLDVDEWAPERTARLADLLAKRGDRDEAWVLRARNARQFQQPVADLGRLPLLGSLPALRAFVELLGAQADAGLAADQQRLAALVGMPPVAAPRAEDQDAARLALDPAPRWLGLRGWTEDGLTGYEERRVMGLWYDTGEGDLHVGRTRPREGTGTLDRNAIQRHAWVRTEEWFTPGRYLVTARIHATTSFIAGALVVGSTRRDRDVRVSFSAGDFLYAIGAKEEAAKLKGVNVSVDGLRERDGPLGTRLRGGLHEFDQEKSWFTLEALVDGPSLTVFVDGAWHATYHTVDGAPIEGHVGFAMGQGAVRVQTPTVERLDRSGAARAPGRLPLPLRLDEHAVLAHALLVNRTFPGLPDAPAGTLLLWVPGPMPPEPGEEPDAVADSLARYAGQAVDFLLRDVAREELPQVVVVALPRSLAERLAGKVDAADGARRGYQVVLHDWWYGDPESGEIVDDQPRLVFVDPVHIARAVTIYIAGGIRRAPELQRWLDVYSAGAVKAADD